MFFDVESPILIRHRITMVRKSKQVFFIYPPVLCFGGDACVRARAHLVVAPVSTVLVKVAG